MTKIKAGGGLIYRISKKGHIKILLIKRKGFWDLPKGKLEKGESMPECAAREIMEEIGLKSYPMIIRPLLNTLHNYKEKSKKYQKTTYWYLMYTAEKSFVPQAAEKIEAVKWVKIDEAFTKVRFDNLRQVIDAFRKVYASQDLA
jgi:8-oxo-dGTP pyrophosphatase MutT (NUDIX family)